jgi:DNA-binding SARP family transcriptional activator
VEFRILGPLEVVERGQSLALGGSRQRTLLALLLTRPNEVVSADRLVDELWPTQPPQNAPNALQYHVSQLRKSLGGTDVLVTQPPGYLIRVGQNELDLLRFERLVDEAEHAAPDAAAQLLRDALALWRGPPLADVAQEPFAQTEILRLEELRVRALELRIEADLARGRHGEVVGELEALVREHPLRERLRAALMRALYGSGRQAEALDVYRETRRTFVNELGIDPSPALQELELAMLRHDPQLADPTQAAPVPIERPIVAVVRDAEREDDLLAIAEPLVRERRGELILVRLLKHDDDLPEANAALAERRRSLIEAGVSTRIAAYTSLDPGEDAARLAVEHGADFILVDAPPALLDTGILDDDLRSILAAAPCDVGALVAAGRARGAGPVVTPFSGIDHDWSAIEVAARLASAFETTLRLLGTEANAAEGRRDASRLLGRASLLVQQVIGIVTEPVLVPPGEGGVLDASRDARLLVIGLSERWRTEGVGRVRLAVAARAASPTLLVRRGVGPGGIAPDHTLTRFTWTFTRRGGEG